MTKSVTREITKARLKQYCFSSKYGNLASGDRSTKIGTSRQSPEWMRWKTYNRLDEKAHAYEKEGPNADS
jgi:hypothetical protein